ncbi:MAG: hypothetical protein KGM98_10780, partial [Bacteroidota bacterium]|nr:hypothetical protein [Bacteroidota bacterium]
MINSISDQSDWDELLDMILEKQVTPILGKEVFQFASGDQAQVLDSWLSAQLLSYYKFTGLPAMSLTQTVNYLIGAKQLKSWDLVRPLKNLINNAQFEFPILKQLLGITDLKYFFNT